MARQRWSSENWRWLQPSFYLNRPGHLALIFLLFVCTSIVIWDRQTLLREHQETISNLEVDKEKLAQKLEEIERFLNDRKLHIGPLKQKDSKNGPLDPDAHLDVNELDLEDADPVARERRNKVKDAMHHAWHSYVKYAWGFDELLPQSTRGENSFGGLGATIVDSLDTLYIMGMHEEFQDAKKWVEENLDFNKHYDASVFETTIRVLGGLLSAYDLSNDSMFLKKAEDLATRLLPAWNTGTGIPYTTINLASGIARNPSWTGGSSVLADLGTEQVELIGLSQRTGNPVYMEKAENVITQLRKNFPSDGLLGIYISPDTGRPTTSKVTFGAMGDSFYEYLLKVWILGNKTESVRHYREMWEQSMEGLTTLIKKTSPSSFSYIAERAGGSLLDKMDELACFAPGMLALGSEGSIPEKKTKYLNLAKELARTCYQFYQITPTKLAGENYYFTEGQDMSVGTAWNILRPETVESLMYLWRRTGDNTYRDWGWEIFQAFEAKCRLETGYAGLRDVRTGVKDDKMQSFFLAETLKYLYLLFSPPDVIPLDRWVFNTEAHPIKIITRREGISTPNSGGEASSQEVQNRRSGEVGHIRNVGLGRAGRLED